MYYRVSGKRALTRPGDQRGAHAKAALKSLAEARQPPGLIGYRGRTPVGWISLGPRGDFARLEKSPVMKPVDTRLVWSIVCFVVPSQYRNQGVARELLAGAIAYARGRGAAVLEAYPLDKDQMTPADASWFGSKRMFDAAGFREVARRRPDRPVVRLVLRNKAADDVPGRARAKKPARAPAKRTSTDIDSAVGAALKFIEEHGVVLVSARGRAPRLVEAIAGEPIAGNWWSHPRARWIYAVLSRACAAESVLVCRLVDGKLTLVHRTLWPALVCVAPRITADRITQLREQHTASGRHVTLEVPFPGWVPADVACEAERIDRPAAFAVFERWVGHQAHAPSGSRQQTKARRT
jgi:GNAT superfamily N-acetyltransferase